MALPSIKNCVGMTVSGTPGTGTITLNAAITGYQSCATAFGANANSDFRFEDGDAWEIARDCAYTHSGTTLTRGTFEASSTGSALSLTSAAKVYVVNSATRIMRELSIDNSIDGLLLGYSATTTVSISAGSCWIEDVEYTQASATTLALTTDNEIGASAIAANSLFFVYAYNNAGAIAYKWDLRVTTADDPVWDSSYRYWKHPTNGTSYRMIGVARTLDTGATIDNISTRDIGGRKRSYVNGGFHQILTVTGTTAANVALAAYVPKNGTALTGFAGAGDTTAAGMAQANFSLYSGVVSNGTGAQIVAKGYVSATSLTLLFGQNTIEAKSTDSVYAVGGSATTYARVYYVGMEYEV